MSSKVGLPTPIEPPHWGQENCEYSGVVLMTTGVIPTVWLDFQPAVGLQHSFPSSSPNPSPSLTVLSRSWSGIHPLDTLTGSSAFFQFQLHANPVSTFFLINNWLHKSIITRTHESKEHVEGEKFLGWNPSVEKQCIAIFRLPGDNAQSLIWNTGSLCLLLTNQNSTVCITFVDLEILHQDTLQPGLVTGCLFHVFPEVFLWEWVKQWL